MPAIPVLRPREAVRAFERLGCQVARPAREPHCDDQTGSNRYFVIPEHATVARGTLRGLIARAGLTVEELLSAVE